METTSESVEDSELGRWLFEFIKEVSIGFGLVEFVWSNGYVGR